MNLELQLTYDKKITFKQHQNFKDSIFAHYPLSNGYVASIITRKPSKKNKGPWDSAQGSWDDGTFELGVLNENLMFIRVEELNDDEDYEINNGVWKNLSKDELLQKIQMISNLKGE